VQINKERSDQTSALLLENISLPYSGNNGKLIWVFTKYALLVTNAGYRVLAVAIIRKKEHIYADGEEKRLLTLGD